MTTTIGVFTVATNIYLDYWMSMVRSADRLLMPGHSKAFHVFTEQPERALALNAELTESRVVPVEIPAYRWPEATLLRYRLIAAHASAATEDVLLHMDADLVVTRPVEGLAPEAWTAGLAFVRHPGFRRPHGRALRLLYLRYPRLWHRDRALRASMGELGAWECRAESRAFVPRPLRREYVYGAIWLGQRTPLLQMCDDLAAAVEDDLARHFIAVWHDESHLNRYAAGHPHTTLDSDLCFVEGWPNLADLVPRILAIDKGGNLTR